MDLDYFEAELELTLDELVVSKTKRDYAKIEVEAARGTSQEAISIEIWEGFLSQIENLELYKANLERLKTKFLDRKS
jgi:hypothetical protein